MRGLSTLHQGADRFYIGVSGEKKPHGYSKWIQEYQKSDYSHALVIFYSQDLEQFIVANCHGVANQLDTLEQFNEGTLIRRLWEIRVSPAQRKKVIHRIVELDGTPYSPNKQMGWLVIAKALSLKWSPWADGDKTMWCSEYADVILEAAEMPASFDLLDDVERFTVTPQDNVRGWSLLAEHSDRVSEVNLG